MFDPNYPYDGTWQDIATGVNPEYANWEDADGATDNAGTPAGPINTRLDGPWGYPWWDGQENPNALAPLPFSPDPLPWSPYETVGQLPAKGAYEGAYRTLGPVRAWGHEPSGGLGGDQAIGRIMRFPANIPERYDANGVFNNDIRDDLAAAMTANNTSYVTDSAITWDLLQWSGDR